MGTILRYFGQFFSLLRQGQFFLLLHAVLGKVLSEHRFNARKSVFYRLSRKDVAPPEDSSDLNVFRGDENDVRRLVRDLYDDTASAHEFYGDIFRDGAEPWLAESDGKIVGVTWLFTGSYLAPWEGYDAWLLRVEVEPTGKFVANVLVDPEMRGRGIFPRIAHRCFEAYPDDEFYSHVDQANVPSIRSHEKIGFRRCGIAYLLRFYDGTRCLFLPKRGKSRFFKMIRGVPADVSLSCKPVCKPD